MNILRSVKGKNILIMLTIFFSLFVIGEIVLLLYIPTHHNIIVRVIKSIGAVKQAIPSLAESKSITQKNNTNQIRETKGEMVSSSPIDTYEKNDIRKLVLRIREGSHSNNIYVFRIYLLNIKETDVFDLHGVKIRFEDLQQGAMLNVYSQSGKIIKIKVLR